MVDLRNFNCFIRREHRVRFGIILQDCAIREVFDATQYVLVVHDWEQDIRQVNDECWDDDTDYKSANGLPFTFVNGRLSFFLIICFVSGLLVL